MRAANSVRSQPRTTSATVWRSSGAMSESNSMSGTSNSMSPVVMRGSDMQVSAEAQGGPVRKQRLGAGDAAGLAVQRVLCGERADGYAAVDAVPAETRAGDHAWGILVRADDELTIGTERVDAGPTGGKTEILDEQAVHDPPGDSFHIVVADLASVVIRVGLVQFAQHVVGVHASDQ